MRHVCLDVFAPTWFIPRVIATGWGRQSETLDLLFLYLTFSQPTCNVLKRIHDKIWPDPWLLLLMDRRKSFRGFKVTEDATTQDPIEILASQTATMAWSQFSQDVMHAVAEKKMNSLFLHDLVKLFQMFQEKKVKQHLFKLVCHYLYFLNLHKNSVIDLPWCPYIYKAYNPHGWTLWFICAGQHYKTWPQWIQTCRLDQCRKACTQPWDTSDCHQKRLV